MSKSINKSKLYMIVSICILCISVLGASVAFYMQELFSENASTITYGLDYYINYAKGQNITSTGLSFSTSYLEGISSDIELWKKDDTYDIYGHIYIDVNEIGENLSGSDALKYAIVNNGSLLAEGSFRESNKGDSILVVPNIPLETTKQLYTVYVWLDAASFEDKSIEGESLSITVKCEATMQIINEKINLLNHILKLYTSGNQTLITQENSGESYYYSYQDSAKSWGLMNDGLEVSAAPGTGASTITNTISLTAGVEGNIRYFGNNPKNYIYFNCDDYSNQTSSTCEKWRIIGIVDYKVKIVRDERLSYLPWGDTYISSGQDHNWEESQLQIFLNGLYYNRGDTTTYEYFYNTDEDRDGGPPSSIIDLEKNGIKESTRKLISESTWYLGGAPTAEIYPHDAYNYERTNNMDRYGNVHTINRNIGLTYISDIGYSSDLTKCNTTMNNDEWEDCFSSSWIGDNHGWLLTPSLDKLHTYYGGAFYMDWYDLKINVTSDASWVHPTLYLDPGLTIYGSGTSSDPYKINVD